MVLSFYNFWGSGFDPQNQPEIIKITNKKFELSFELVSKISLKNCFGGWADG
jgi:hypothetical protein